MEENKQHTFYSFVHVTCGDDLYSSEDVNYLSQVHDHSSIKEAVDHIHNAYVEFSKNMTNAIENGIDMTHDVIEEHKLILYIFQIDKGYTHTPTSSNIQKIFQVVHTYGSSDSFVESLYKLTESL